VKIKKKDKSKKRSKMKNKKLLVLWVFIFVFTVGASLVYAQDKIEEMDVDTNAYELPPQGTFIPCELCVILYPERYEKEPQTCPICQGAKEHFQPAQMMTREMAQMQLYELDLKIQQLMYQTIMDSLSKPVDLDQLKKMHKLYKRKLIHLLVYDFLEVEPVKEKIRQLDEAIEFREKT
jgi:hypothetical protein